MKKRMYILLMLPLLLVACGSDDDEKKEQAFFVNVFVQMYEGDKEDTVNKSYVYLFREASKTIDFNKSSSSIANDTKITYTDGTIDSPIYISSSTNGINTFENIENGQYTLWVVYNNYSRFYSSSKEIKIDSNFNAVTEKKVFLYKDITGFYSYQTWSDKW